MQAADKVFFVDPPTGQKIGYGRFLSEISRMGEYRRFVKADSVYEYFKAFVFACLLDREIVLLDSDFSDAEIRSLADLPMSEILRAERVAPVAVPDIPALVGRLKKCAHFRATLFTSGTTGRPKKVSHTLAGLSRFVGVGAKHADDIWGFAYNPAHMAGLQVFLQALFNGNTVVRLFGLGRGEIFSAIADYRITHISATPTFYRMLLPPAAQFARVRRITSGGERFTPSLSAEMEKMFPNAKIANVYASTEAGTLFAADGDKFTVKDAMRPLVKIVGGELFLHKSLLGESDSFALDGDWYATGDIVEVVSENPLSLKFSRRKSDMINTGGYKVNPREVEDALLAVDGIKQAAVYGRANPILGNVVCAKVVPMGGGIDEAAVREALRKTLQGFKIPRIIETVEELPQTRTGKSLA